MKIIRYENVRGEALYRTDGAGGLAVLARARRAGGDQLDEEDSAKEPRHAAL